MQFPVHLYRSHPNGTWPVAGREGLHKIASVNDADELAAMLANGQGWFVPGDLDALAINTSLKITYSGTIKLPSTLVADDTSPPTRAELEQKAAELGIKVHHKTGDAKLAAMIAAALEG